MSRRYTADGRVTAMPDSSYLVDVHGSTFRLTYDVSRAWTISAGADLGLADNWVMGYATPDDALHVLLGQPTAEGDHGSMTATIIHPTASAVVVDFTNSRVLLVEHLGAGLFLLPGGHVEDGETPVDAAVREVYEETGVTITILGDVLDLPGMTCQPTPLVTAVMSDPSGKPHSHLDYLYVARGDSRVQIVRQADEVGDAGWFDIDALHSFRVRAEVPSAARLAADFARTR